MLSWLGMRNVSDKNPDHEFFGHASKRAIVVTLTSSLTILFLIKGLLTYLIPEDYMADPLIAIMPAVVGLLVALLYLMVLERLLQDRHTKHPK